MIDRIVARLPEAWRGLAELLAAPIAWVPALQQMLLAFFLDPQPSWLAAVKYAFLLFPVLLGIVAIWCTGLGVYTLPFRSSRTRFVSLFLLAWWDAAIMVWMYWVGIVRIALVATGWALSLARLTVRLVVGFIRDVVGAPFAMSSMLVRAYFRPGVPWLAFVALIFWCVLEAAVFAYTLHPRVAVLVADLAGADDVAWLTAPILYLMVLALTLASFVCVQALVDAVRRHDNRFLAQIIFIETFAIFFEVAFLYRGLVEVTMPWIASDNVIAIVAAVGAWLASAGSRGSSSVSSAPPRCWPSSRDTRSWSLTWRTRTVCRRGRGGVSRSTASGTTSIGSTARAMRRSSCWRCPSFTCWGRR